MTAASRVGAEDGLRDYAADYLRHGAGHNCKHRLALALSQELGYGQVSLSDQAGTGKSIDRTTDPSLKVTGAAGSALENVLE